MAFGGGFGGFGSTNNQQQSTGFGGFGQSANNNNAGGFGATNTTPAFGASNTAGGTSLFGGGNNNNAAGGFGGFGSSANTTSPFGAAKPAATFGAPATTGGNMFGGGAATSGSAFGSGGGFGNTANTTPAFGSSAGGGGLFGQAAKPATGFGGATGGGMFGGGNTSTPAAGGFGTPAAPASTGGFGGFGGGTAAAQQTPQNNGTGGPPFQAHVEKDAASSSNSHYQSITFQQPYSAFSFEELRVADYAAGRKNGNSNGQAGAFGTSTGFGGFGNAATTTPATGFGASPANAGGGLFGQNNNAGNATSSPFGQSAAPASGGFGAAAGGGMFGAAKPATGGLFGSAPAASTGTTGGGLFGTSGTNTGTGFGGFGGAAANTTANTGGGLFGQNNNQAAKPAAGFGSSFGASTGGFGAAPAAAPFGQTNNTTGGGLFGQNNNSQQQPATGGGLFGQNNNQQAQPAQQSSGGGLFGGFGQNNNNQQQGQTGTTGGLFGGGGFGQNNQQNNQPKPGGLFGGAGATNTGSGGLFGQNNNTQQQPAAGGGLFGQNNNQQSNAGGSLFGGPKPATGGSLFGASATNTGQTGTGGGLFGGLGQNNQQQNGGGGLFGQSANNNQPKPGGLFGGGLGGSTNNAGGGLFGGGSNNNGGGLFGASNNQQQGFGGSQQNQQPQQNLAASLASNPYGNDQLFTNLGQSSAPVGPLATPLSGAQKTTKRPTPLPQFKINPSASLRLITPQKRSTGYGLNYNTYGTPGSGAQGFQSNGLGGSLLQSGGLSRSLGKSFSTTNLRSTFSPEADTSSVLAPGAFTPNSRPYAGGSIRRLKIDRNLRTDLFGEGVASEPSTLNRKRVSFTDDSGKSKELAVNGASSDIVPTRRESEESPDSSYRRPSPAVNGNKVNGTPRQEMEQVRGNELAIVPEDEAAPASSTSTRTISKDLPKSHADPAPGEYWMSPSIQELRNMSRDQLKKVHGFTVGRVGVGRIDFDDVDLTSVPLDDIFEGIVKLHLRSATVYETGVNTPPMGKGLNVPSTITLQNSWPRSHGGRLPVHEKKGPRFDKHLERLKRVVNTEFISYDAETGVWIFRVQHFTTYGLDDSDDEEEYTMDTDQQSPTPQAVQAGDECSIMSAEDSNPDDTFDFKKGPSKNLPGNFDGDQSIYEDEDMADDTDAQDDSSFLEQRGMSMLDDPFGISGSGNAAALAVQAEDRPADKEVEEHEPGSINLAASIMPKSILKQSTLFAMGTPKKDLALTGDWAEQLQRTVSPKKQDRHALRERQSVMGAPPVPTFAASVAGKTFNTTMDIMNSLWEPAASTTGNVLKNSSRGKGFEWPYPRRSRVNDAFADMSESDRAFHSSMKPRWTVDNHLVYSIAGNAPQVEGSLAVAKRPIVAEGKDIRFAKFSGNNAVTSSLHFQMKATKIAILQKLPAAYIPEEVTFLRLAESVESDNPIAKHERAVWKLASILFDPVRQSCASLAEGLSNERITELEHQIRRDALCDFWTDLVREDSSAAARDAATAEEKALAFLTGNDIEEACAALVEGSDLRIATIIAQLPGNKTMKDMIKKQIDAWRSQNVLSEMSETMRTLYEIAAGNVCVSEGKTGAAEDRASTFSISTRFGLDWRRSFGLRLWFGNDTESIADAVHAYAEDIASGEEAVRPVPYFTEQGLATTWDDPESQDREDTLLGLLKLYSRRPSEAGTPITDLLSPTSVSGNPLDARLAWQLAALLGARNIISQKELTTEMFESLSLSFAQQLEAASQIRYAIKVILHNTIGSARVIHVRPLLWRYAPALNAASDANSLPESLTVDLKLPERWIWHARALYARSALDNHVAACGFLIRAGAWNDAHEGFCRNIAPQAIVSQDYDALREMIGKFKEVPEARAIVAWSIGCQIYIDYLDLLELESKQSPKDAEHRKSALTRLVQHLPETLGLKHKDKVQLEERVAIGVIANHVRSVTEKLIREEKERVSQEYLGRIPTTGDAYARQSVGLTETFYKGLAEPSAA